MKVRLWKKLRHLGSRLDVALALLNSIIERLDTMASQVSQDLKALSDKFDEATNEIGRDLADLRSQIKNSMTDAEVQEVKDSLQSKIDRLTVLGQDPANPVP